MWLCQHVRTFQRFWSKTSDTYCISASKRDIPTTRSKTFSLYLSFSLFLSSYLSLSLPPSSLSLSFSFSLFLSLSLSLPFSLSLSFSFSPSLSLSLLSFLTLTDWHIAHAHTCTYGRRHVNNLNMVSYDVIRYLERYPLISRNKQNPRLGKKKMLPDFEKHTRKQNRPIFFGFFPIIFSY